MDGTWSAGLCIPIRYTWPALPQNLNDTVEQRRGAMTTKNDDSSDPDESSEDTDSEYMSRFKIVIVSKFGFCYTEINCVSLNKPCLDTFSGLCNMG